MENLAHSASFQTGEKIAPSKPGIKHLADAGRATECLLRRYEAALFEVAIGLAICGALDGAEVAKIVAAFPARQAAG
jgi:hypothetical protein